MTVERWRKIEDIFVAALQLPEDRRDQYVREAAGTDRELYLEVASMLVSHEQNSGVLGESPVKVIAGFLDPAPGDSFDRYTITRPLGAGGMGRIYEARDSRLDRLVALKLLPPNPFLTPGLAERFSREAKVASCLNHPNVVTVLDFHTLPQPYLVTELVEGETLRSRMPLSPHEADDALRQLASALAAVHRAGICHRDIKPENVMVRTDGLVKLIDFGLARLPNADTFQTASGVVMGTYAYMAPEQMFGRDTDARSDVWSFGVLAQELTHGDASWRAVIDKCLQQEPSRRFQDGAALLAAVESRSRPVGRRIVVVAGGAIVASAIGGAAWWRARPTAPSVRAMVPLTDFGDVLRSAVSPDGRSLAMVCGFDSSQRLLVRHLPSGSDVTLVPPSPVQFSGVAVSPDGNFVYATYGSATELSSLWRYPTVGGDRARLAEDVDSPAAVDPSGVRVCFVRRTPKSSLLLVADRSSERVLAEQPPENPFTFAGPAWSPDGRSIAIAAGFQARILLVDAARGTISHVPGKPASFIGKVAWRDNNTLVAPVSPAPAVPAQLQLIDARSGAATALTNDVSGYFEPGVLDAGKITALRQDFFSYLSISPGPRRVSFGREHFNYVRWTGDDSLVLTRRSGNRYDLWRFHVATGSRTRLTDDAWSERHPCWSPAARRFAVFSDRDGEWNLWSFDAEGRNWTQLTTGKTAGMYPDWTPDGRHIVFEATRDRIFGVWLVAADGSGLRRLRAGVTRFPAVSTDGKRVACVYEEDDRWRIGLFDLANGRLLKVVREGSLFSPPRWQPDGRGLLWVESSGRESNLMTSHPSVRVLRRLEEQGRVESFDLNTAGETAHVSGVRQGDVVRLDV